MDLLNTCKFLWALLYSHLSFAWYLPVCNFETFEFVLLTVVTWMMFLPLCSVILLASTSPAPPCFPRDLISLLFTIHESYLEFTPRLQLTSLMGSEQARVKWDPLYHNLKSHLLLQQMYHIPSLCLTGSDGRESVCNAGDSGSIPGSGRSPGEGNGCPLQCSCLGNPTDRGTWRAYSPRGHKEADLTERLTLSFHFCLGHFLCALSGFGGGKWEGGARASVL